MSGTNLEEKLSQFLVRAKIVTYASGSDTFKVSPTLADAHQLEYAEGNLLYRDIYYGGTHFIGMETVFRGGQANWGMSYYGGILPGSSDSQISGMPSVLKAALQKIPLEAPYRGPKYFTKEDYVYQNEIHGELFCFHGTEIISVEGQSIYRLRYSGGLIES